MKLTQIKMKEFVWIVIKTALPATVQLKMSAILVLIITSFTEIDVYLNMTVRWEVIQNQYKKNAENVIQGA